MASVLGRRNSLFGRFAVDEPDFDAGLLDTFSTKTVSVLISFRKLNILYVIYESKRRQNN